MERKVVKKVAVKKKATKTLGNQPTGLLSALGERAKTLDTVVPIMNASIRLNIILGSLLILMMFCFVVALWAYANKPVERKYIVQDQNGRIISELMVMDEPLANKSTVSARVDECLRGTFNLDYRHWKRQLSKMEPCYTEGGFSELVANIDNQGLIRDLTRTYSVADLTPKNPMRVTGSNVDVINRETMQVKGSFFYTLYNATEDKGARKLAYRVEVVAIVVEVPIHESPYGFAINRLTLKIVNA